MKRLLSVLLILTLWSSCFAAYYVYKPHGEFNWNNVGTQPDSVRLIDWTLPDTFYHVSPNMNYFSDGGFEFDSTVSLRGFHDLTFIIYYQSGTVKLRDNFRYEVKDTLPQSFAVNLDNATGTLSDAQVDNITVTAGTVSDKTGYSLASTQTFNNTGTWAGNITGSLSGSVGSVTGSVGSVTGAVGSVTGNVGGSVNSVTNPVTVGSVNAGSIDSADFASTAISLIKTVHFDYTTGTIDSSETGGTFKKMIALRADSGVTISLTAGDIQDIIDGVVAAGIVIDTAALRHNLETTPMIIGTNNDKTNYGLAAGAINSAAFAASGAHVIAQASDSGGLVLVDYNIIASTAYDYFTAGNREDVFKGGAGAGPDTTLIYVLSALDSTPIVGASVSYFVGASKLATATDSLGLAIFGATAGTYTAIAEAKPRYASTVSVTAGSVATIYMTQPAIPDPSDTALTGVYGYVYNLSGSPVAGAIIVARNQGRDIQVGNLIVSQYEVSDTTDAAGFWSLPLYPTSTLGGSAYKYTFSLFRGSQQVIRKPDITVPNQASWQFDW